MCGIFKVQTMGLVELEFFFGGGGGLGFLFLYKFCGFYIYIKETVAAKVLLSLKRRD